MESVYVASRPPPASHLSIRIESPLLPSFSDYSSFRIRLLFELILYLWFIYYSRILMACSYRYDACCSQFAGPFRKQIANG